MKGRGDNAPACAIQLAGAPPQSLGLRPSCWGSAPVPARGCEPLLPHHFPHHAAALRPLASAIRVQSYFLTK
jgi:hypothetical protein